MALCEVLRPRIAPDDGGVVHVIGQGRRSRPIICLTPPAVEYDYRGCTFNIYFTRLKFIVIECAQWRMALGNRETAKGLGSLNWCERTTTAENLWAQRLGLITHSAVIEIDYIN